MIFKNKEVREMASEIIEKGIEFKKGAVGGFSIEISENDPESLPLSYTMKMNLLEIWILTC